MNSNENILKKPSLPHCTVHHHLQLHPCHQIGSCLSFLTLINIPPKNFFLCLLLQEKPIVPQPQSSNGSVGLPKTSTNNVDTVDSTSVRNGGSSIGDQPDDYEKEERRRAAQRVLGKQG